MIRKYTNQRMKNGGFTLIELMVTFSVYALISTFVVANYREYNNSSIASNAPESIVTAIREAQVYGSAGKKNTVLCGASTSLFDCRFGVNLTPAQGFTLFVDKNDNKVYDVSDIKLETVTWKDKSAITAVNCYGGGFTTCTSNVLNVTFKRPSPDAIVNDTSDMTGVSSGGYNYGKITVTNGLTGAQLKTRVITVSQTGQLSIQ